MIFFHYSENQKTTVSDKLNVFEEVLCPLKHYVILMADICAW